MKSALNWVKRLSFKKRESKKKDNNILNLLSQLKGWKNLKIGQKYGLAFTLTSILFAISAIVIFFQLSNVQNEMKNVEQDGKNAIIITEMTSTFEQLGSEIRLFIQTNNVRHLNAFEEKRLQFEQLSDQVRPAMSSDLLKSYFRTVTSNEQALVTLFNESVVPSVKASQKLESMSYSAQADDLISVNVGILDELRKALQEHSDQSINDASTSITTTVTILIASIVISAILGALVMLFIGRQIGQQFNILIDVSNNIANGNLNVDEIDASGKDEISSLSNSINMMRESLQSMIQEISAVSNQVTEKSEILTVSSNEVKAASQQVASTMQELATGSEEQANTANHLAELMETFTNRIQTANSNGQDINDSSLLVLEMTQKGNEYMNASTNQMNKINEIMKSSVDKVNGLDSQTKQISTLVKVIQDIAAQTNLLALNAAIEAARAGDHGRGFAVVADEVRKLAVQVADSVSDITEIVGSIQTESKNVAESLQIGYKEVELGTQQIDVTSQTFKDINSDVTRMVENIKGISEHLFDVTERTIEINTSIENIASVSEESAAGIEQTSASVQQTNSSMEQISDHAETLSELAGQLNNMILKFKL
ncbi:methyl-accepting chemotaxis protein [Litchfieldia alkalitelluris]|uniref:methyl-accepting chemotaxis protein n=1 Tax=Litchfieldia alkalitelluris TaxID=304268 RepID=UPI000996644B|nr:methyl-accepting chemotaxis protein [Litchfieldia alkalitelluris]